ncbi:hypothetical protein CALVIDRAFT_361137 [Calocera viscosa TUFC12733]|uniref:Uncharacterized protein n=1 Tax=Calocera viscosa (strain TUFC12733) TaxID=1330018 RepID=A0A167H6K4_CALVF|nr:hypothetical protein CALVIDRAFT_361137 [Calocera viscosa TUFC12733]
MSGSVSVSVSTPTETDFVPVVSATTSPPCTRRPLSRQALPSSHSARSSSTNTRATSNSPTSSSGGSSRPSPGSIASPRVSPAFPSTRVSSCTMIRRWSCGYVDGDVRISLRLWLYKCRTFHYCPDSETDWVGETRPLASGHARSGASFSSHPASLKSRPTRRISLQFPLSPFLLPSLSFHRLPRPIATHSVLKQQLATRG